MVTTELVTIEVVPSSSAEEDPSAEETLRSQLAGRVKDEQNVVVDEQGHWVKRERELREGEKATSHGREKALSVRGNPHHSAYPLQFSIPTTLKSLNIGGALLAQLPPLPDSLEVLSTSCMLRGAVSRHETRDETRRGSCAVDALPGAWPASLKALSLCCRVCPLACDPIFSSVDAEKRGAPSTLTWPKGTSAASCECCGGTGIFRGSNEDYDRRVQLRKFGCPGRTFDEAMAELKRCFCCVGEWRVGPLLLHGQLFPGYHGPTFSSMFGEVLHLHNLPPLPPNLRILELSECAELRELPALPSTLHTLRLWAICGLRTMPPLPAQLRRLQLMWGEPYIESAGYRNRYTGNGSSATYPQHPIHTTALPEGLEVLQVCNLPGATLPFALPPKLRRLEIHHSGTFMHDDLEAIDTLPDTLTHLFIHADRLKRLPAAWPERLMWLRLECRALEEMPALTAGISNARPAFMRVQDDADMDVDAHGFVSFDHPNLQNPVSYLTLEPETAGVLDLRLCTSLKHTDLRGKHPNLDVRLSPVTKRALRRARIKRTLGPCYPVLATVEALFMFIFNIVCCPFIMCRDVGLAGGF